MNKKKAAIYCRLSEEDRNKACETDDSGSIQNQKAMLVEYAMEQGWDIYQIYSDDDYAGSDRNRPQFKKMLEEAEQRKFDIVLCKTQSRFTRELELVEKYIHGLFPVWGIRFISIVDHADTDNYGNKKSRQINGLVNEWYLEDMSRSIKSALDTRRKNGYHIGAFALYGYRKDPEQKGHLVVDEEAAAVVKEVFDLFEQGYGKTAIARMLNDRGIPNPTEYKRRKGLRYYQPQNPGSVLWKYFNIADMLENEMYIGNMVQGRCGSVSYKSKQNKPRPKDQWIRVEGTHEAIIGRDQWDRVQAIIARRTKPCYSGKVGLFAGKAVCQNCGYTMRSTRTKDRNYLTCPTRHFAKDACIGSFISVKKLEEAVAGELRKLADEYADSGGIASGLSLDGSLASRKKSLQDDIQAYRKKMDEYGKGLRELYLDKVKGLITEAMYIELSGDFQEEKERYGQLIAQAEESIRGLDDRIRHEEDRRSLVEKYLRFDHLERTDIEALVDHIVVGRKDPETKQVPVEIYWNF